ncbi:MAG: hypothetical protein JOY90_20870 [Bradyrhizobium sp.]|uniref:hypothetical protein n=1 Tax=Bradyrhizobium sp. TaxID=376 RepID=UPI001DF6CADF|nr:hypothetical protein [Bradyrhizobium sp.]MBV9562867.1 hypothetical protein [Bradyrhizobium sp.]
MFSGLSKKLSKELSRKSVGALALFWSGSALAAGQCFAPSDPVRLTPDQQRAVVLNIRDNPDVFQSDFSLMRTLKNILGTVPGGDPATVTDDAAKDLLKSLLAGFAETSLRNEDGDISFALTPRDGESALTVDDLLGPTSPARMVPVALFNRLDLAPADHSHCGEYRIVYVKSGPKDGSGRVAFDKRMTLIFEAVLPNPDLSGDRRQCEAVWRLWKGFAQPGQSQAQIGQWLAKFYYEGGALDSQMNFTPVVSFSHYGIAGGQVRANAFDHVSANDGTLNWHLRQWRVSFDPNNPTNPPSFQPQPVNETPFRGYFSGDAASSPGSDPARFRALAGLFASTFPQVNEQQLVAVDSLAAIPVGPETTVADLIDNVGVDIDDKFYAVESDAGPFGGPAPDDPAVAIGANQALAAAIDNRLQQLKVDTACGLNRGHVLNRMAAMTCGGCHQFANGKEIAPGVRWPLSLNFVQIDENGAMSNLLLDRFLPFRFRLMNDLPPPPVVAPPLQALALHQQLRKQLTAFKPTQDAVRSVQNLSNEIRKADRSQPGAFVRYRKPD